MWMYRFSNRQSFLSCLCWWRTRNRYLFFKMYFEGNEVRWYHLRNTLSYWWQQMELFSISKSPSSVSVLSYYLFVLEMNSLFCSNVMCVEFIFPLWFPLWFHYFIPDQSKEREEKDLRWQTFTVWSWSEERLSQRTDRHKDIEIQDYIWRINNGICACCMLDHLHVLMCHLNGTWGIAHVKWSNKTREYISDRKWSLLVKQLKTTKNV